MKKTVLIPIGDPAGIGPEIVVRALQNRTIYEMCNPVVVGDRAVLERISGILDSFVRIRPVNDVNAPCEYATINLLDVGCLSRNESYSLKFGEISELAGRAAYSYIKIATDVCLSNSKSCMATTPINKQAIKLAGICQPGHTEIIANLTGVVDPLTMFQTNLLRIFFLSRHVSLRQACAMVTYDRVLEYIIRSLAALTSLGLNDGSLAVSGLNPHNSDGGMFGDEEQNIIIPAIQAAQSQGCNCVGPIPADSVFAAAKLGKYPAVLSLYHDQGHIAAKTLDFHKTISLTIGLPFLRTSVDHGTGFDIAGQGVANSASMIEAILAAAKYDYVDVR
ncbi:MAG: 4-hydroxythreonine-4-phosphate dehydrogenase PdxA [Negativicutes bacterium]|jgi:4-hydroxythreonine-4-phosphate dehydrogenase